METYSESDFVAYAFVQMGVEIVKREGHLFELTHGFEVEVEGKDLYRLSHGGWVISPFNDIGKLCEFIQRNTM